MKEETPVVEDGAEIHTEFAMFRKDMINFQLVIARAACHIDQELWRARYADASIARDKANRGSGQ
jgi:hypothetical protein